MARKGQVAAISINDMPVLAADPRSGEAGTVQRRDCPPHRPGFHRMNAMTQAPSFGTVWVSSATQMFFVSM